MEFTDDQMRESYAKHAAQNDDSGGLFYAVCRDVLGYSPLGQFIRDTTEFDAFEERYEQLFGNAPGLSLLAEATTPSKVGNAVALLEQENERLRKEINAKQAEINAKQAEIDRLMLEFCPDEMTEEQKAEWAARQRPA